MKLKLIINGEDHRVRLIPSDQFDKKLLDLLEERHTARVVPKKELYGHYLEYVDLVLEVSADQGKE